MLRPLFVYLKSISTRGSIYKISPHNDERLIINLVPSMSRAGNCHDNAIAESFFATIKKRIVKRNIYSTREDAKGEIFNFIEMFYNPKKRHSHTGGVSPAKFEEAYYSELKTV